MTARYATAEVCYAHLTDVPGPRQVEIGSDFTRVRNIEDGWLQHFFRSRWFRRGWTLQELLAPNELLFYDQDWCLIGNLQNLKIWIAHITGIEQDVLDRTVEISQVSIAARMSWMSNRSTRRPEDHAYSLLGLFNVHMPLLYGEGGRASFARLQEEIIKTSSDHSVFAWNYNFAETTGSLLAWSPLNFLNGSRIIQDYDVTRDNSHVMTNSGLRINLPVIKGEGERNFLAILNCRLKSEQGKVLALKIRSHPSQDHREKSNVFHVTADVGGPGMFSTTINRPGSRLAAIDIAENIERLANARKYEIIISRQTGITSLDTSAWRVSKAWCRIEPCIASSGLAIQDAYPREHWDRRHLVLVLPRSGSFHHQMDCGILFSHPSLPQGTALAVCFARKQSHICPAVLKVVRPTSSTLEDICSWLEFESASWFVERLPFLPRYGLVKLNDSIVLQIDMQIQDVVGEALVFIRFSTATELNPAWLSAWDQYGDAVSSTFTSKITELKMRQQGEV